MLQQSNKAAQIAQDATENVEKISNVAGSSLERLSANIAENAPNIIAGLLVFFLFWIIARIAKTIFGFASRRAELDQRLRTLFGRLMVVAIVVVGLFTALTIIIPKFGFGDLIAGLGFSSFIIGFATKDILNNFFSGILVLWHEPFKLGDYVIVDSFEGEVVEIGIRATRLTMYDGEQILVPNGKMYTDTLIIREAGALHRIKIDIVVDYKSLIGKAKELILSALDSQEGVVDDPPPAVFLTDMATEGIHLTSYIWVDTENFSLLEVRDEASRSINHILRENGFKLFPPKPVLVDSITGNGKTRRDDEL